MTVILGEYGLYEVSCTLIGRVPGSLSFLFSLSYQMMDYFLGNRRSGRNNGQTLGIIWILRAR